MDANELRALQAPLKKQYREQPETWYQGPAAIRCVSESLGGVRKVW